MASNGSNKAKGAPKAAPTHPHLRYYAYAGVAVMSGLSAALNGYSHSQHSPVTWAGWGMGLAVPLIILILGKVAGMLWKGGHRRLGGVTAASGAGLLALSVWHCSTAIAVLTGSPVALAAPMALAVDAGFVCCEIATICGD